MTAPGLADCASVHAPVCAGNNGAFERLGFYKTAKADTAERADGPDHFRGQFHFLVDRLLLGGTVVLVHKASYYVG